MMCEHMSTRTDSPIHATALVGSSELPGFEGSVICGRRWGVTAGGSGEGPCRGVRFKFKFMSSWAGH
jgi:hypothetical protein